MLLFSVEATDRVGNRGGGRLLAGGILLGTTGFGGADGKVPKAISLMVMMPAVSSLRFFFWLLSILAA